MKRRLFTILTVSVLALSLVLCSCSDKNQPSGSKSTNNSQNSDQSFKIAFLEYDNGYTENEMREKFIYEMRMLGYDEMKIKIDVRNAQSNNERLTEYANSFKDSDYNLIVAIADKAASAVSKVGLDVPCVFIGATDPVADGLVTNPDKPDKNMTGTVMDVSDSKSISLIRIFTPEVKTVGIMISAGNTQSQKEAEQFAKAAKSEGLVTKTYTLDSTAKAVEVTKSIISENDAVYIPADVSIDKVMGNITKVTSAQKKFVFSSGTSAVKAGALAAYCSSPEIMAQKAASMADSIFKGTKVSEIPVDFSVEANIFLSSKTYSLLGIGVPELSGLVVL